MAAIDHRLSEDNQNCSLWTDANGRVLDEDDRGLIYDMKTLISRRRALGVFGGLTTAGLLAACSSGSTGRATTGSSPNTGSSNATSSTTGSSGTENIVEVPDETAGPYPGDGSNGINVLDDTGIVRSDIRSSFGSSTTTAEGVPLRIRLTVRDAASGDALSGAAVYVWHCDRDGNYSLYSQAIANENYLRGVQEVDSSGTVTFTSIFPGCYSGRWPHIHFEVYAGLSDAIASGSVVKTSQIALPKGTCNAVYATSGYQGSIGNLSQVSLSIDNVFGDDAGIHQVASMSGDAASGYTAALTIGV
jgi:protocatechuate 3,4-dioxygenase beta subunit